MDSSWEVSKNLNFAESHRRFGWCPERVPIKEWPMDGEAIEKGH